MRIPKDAPGPPSPVLEALLRERERRLDVGLGAALIAQEDQPELDAERSVDELEEWASLARQHLVRQHDPRERLQAFNAFFFETLGMSASPTRGASRYDEDRLADLLLPHVMRRRSGHCVGLSTLYLALGYRLRLPLYGVSVPGHFFVRWDGEGLRQNIELTSRGAVHDDEYYVERFKIGSDQVDRGVYLQSLRRREVLVEVLNNRANFYWDRGDEARVLRDLDRVVRLSSNFAQAYVGRGFVNLQRGDLRAAEKDLREALEIDQENARAWLLLGQSLLRRGVLEAEDALARATELDPQSALAATYLGLLYQSRGHPARASDWQKNALQLDPRCYTAWVHIGQARLSIGKREKAAEAFRMARRLRPEGLRAQEGLVLSELAADGSLSWRGRRGMERVCDDYERRLELAPNANALRSSFLRFLGESRRRPQRASKLATELLGSSPTVANVELAATALARLGMEERALDLVEKTLTEGEDHSENEHERLEGLAQRIRGTSSDPL